MRHHTLRRKGWLGMMGRCCHGHLGCKGACAAGEARVRPRVCGGKQVSVQTFEDVQVQLQRACRRDGLAEEDDGPVEQGTQELLINFGMENRVPEGCR
jgi:hypothetical protein